MNDTPKLGYLSGAPRVSTHPDAEMGGPRSHVLGVMHGFESLGWQVESYIVGDHVPVQWRNRGSEKLVSSSWLKTVGADAVRLGLRVRNSRRAYQALRHKVDWTYERFALFQAMGSPFQRTGIPWILETNAVYFQEAKADRKSLVLARLAKMLELNAYQQCDALVCVSQALKQELIDVCNVDPTKIIVVPNGVDTTHFDPTRHKPIRIFEEFTVGFVGQLYAWQGLDLLLHAVQALKQEGTVINVVIVGDGQMREVWQTLTTQLGITEQVYFTGNVTRDEVPAYIAGFDVGFSGKVLPKSGVMYFSPLKLYEYLAMGKPVVCNADEDSIRVIRPQQTGFLYTTGDQQQLQIALKSAFHAAQTDTLDHTQARLDISQSHSWKARVNYMTKTIIEYFEAQAHVNPSALNAIKASQAFKSV